MDRHLAHVYIYHMHLYTQHTERDIHRHTQAHEQAYMHIHILAFGLLGTKQRKPRGAKEL